MKPSWTAAFVVSAVGVLALAAGCHLYIPQQRVVYEDQSTPPPPRRVYVAPPQPTAMARPPATSMAPTYTPPPPLIVQAPPTEEMYTPPPPPPGELPSETPGAPPQPAEEQPDVLTSGPVHEAFDQPVDLQSQEGLIAPQAPPPAIDEDPPADKPEGDNVVWVPGYWAWDTDRADYVWVSGCWRNAPPGLEWVAGYWAQQPDGFEWVAGFWGPANADEIEYLPAPPIVEQIEPPGPSPSPDRVWVPGCWYWRAGHFVWRGGYWLLQRPDWVWVPSHYVWTPRGYVFVQGHWDYPLEVRGVLFAPVYFRTHRLRSRFAFSPSIAFDVNELTVHLFACPRYSHYYFGDYYGDDHLRAGIYPWFDSARVRTWYDPIFEHDRWSHRNERGWEESRRHEYDLRRTDKTLRPPKTYHDLDILLRKLPAPERTRHTFAAPLSVMVTRKTSPLRFERINSESRSKIKDDASDLLTLRQERARWESVPLNDHGIVGHVTTLTGHEETIKGLTADDTSFHEPRRVNLTEAEHVKIPASALRHMTKGRSTTKAGKAPPDRPADEDKSDQSKGRGK